MRRHRVACAAALLALVLGGCDAEKGGEETPTPVEPATPADEAATAAPPQPAGADEALDAAAAATAELTETLREVLSTIPDERRGATYAPDVDVESGKVTYQTTCHSCHGEDARGDGPAAEHLDPAPGDLSDSRRARKTTAGEKAYIVLEGVGGASAMPPFKAALSEKQVWEVVAYLESLSRTTETAQ